MKKIKNLKEKIGWFSQCRWWIVAAFTAFVFVPLFINWLYKIPAPIELLDAEWEPGDGLSFYGTILASFFAIVGVRWTINHSQKNYREDERNRVRPYLALTHLRSKRVFDRFFDDSEEENSAKGTSSNKEQYEEYKLDHIYIIVNANSVNYVRELTASQKILLESGGQKWEETIAGVYTLTSKDFISLPFEVENVGNGSALCLHIGLYSGDMEKEGIFFYTVKPSEKVYVHIFSRSLQGILDRDYFLEFHYRDIIGTSYLQKFPVRFEMDTKSRRVQQKIDLVGEQTVTGDVENV